jgi:fatty acid amide hydrolase 2
MPLGDPHQVRVDELRYFVIDGNGRVPVHADLQRAQHSAAEHLRRLGARVVGLRIERLRHSFEIWSAMLEEASDTPYKVLLGSGRPIGAVHELGRWAVRRSPHTLPSILLALTEHLPAMLPGHAAKMLAQGHALKAELDALLGDDGVLLYPPYARPAPRHLMPLLGPLEWTYTAILNVMELPVTQVPLGLNAKGVPVGVQVVGGHGQDHLTMAVALELERAFGGWIPPRTHPRYNRSRSAP